MKKQITLLLPFFLLLSCNIINLPQNTDDSGEIKVNFKFPQKTSGFNIKAIPDNTDHLEISVFTNKANIKDAIRKTIKKSETDEKTGEAKVSLKKLTVGDKYVEVRAYDQGNKILASAREKTVIKPNAVVKVVLELKVGDLPELKDEKINNPKGMPSGNLPPKLDASGKPIQPNPSGIPPKLDASGKPIQPNPSGMPPKLDASGNPIQPNPSGMPPKLDASGNPIQPNPSGMPPKLDASGNPIQPSPSGILSPKPTTSGTPLPPNPSPSGILSPKPITSGTPLPPNPSPSGILSPKPITSGTPLPPNPSPSGILSPKPIITSGTPLPPPPIKP